MLELTPEYKDGLLQFNDLLLLAILWCAGDMICKAEAFFKCLNPPGQSQDGISANDKDWDSVFDKLVYLASIFTYKVAAAFGETVEEYDEEFHKKAIKVMRTSEIEPDEDPHKAGFLNIVYGFESRLDREEFINEVQLPKANWIFDSEQVRHRLKHFLDPDFVDENL
jgi:hypothetical protein